MTPLDNNSIDDAADTLRFNRIDAPVDPDATSMYDLRGVPQLSPARRRQIYRLRRDIAGLRAALAAGWDVGLELEHEEHRLAALEDTTC